MRYKLRISRLVALLLITVVLFSLLATQRLPTKLDFPSYNLSNGNQNSTELDTPDGIQLLWEQWSKTIHDHGPLTQHISLSSTAGPVGVPSSDHSPRQPSTNRVVNSESDIESLHTSHAAFLEKLRSEDVSADIYEGTGVVMMGGGEYFGPAIVGLHMLRKTGCTLPVEIFVADQSEYETSLCEDYLPRFKAKCIVLSDLLLVGLASPRFDVSHYQLKSLAIFFSSFAEVLYLDSDSIPLHDPSTDLFSTEPYTLHGMVIWPDFWVSTESPLFYTIAGLCSFPSDLPKTSSEAGQLLINKNTHLKTLLLALYYNIYGPDFYYPLLSQGVLGQGDKETFMAAAVVTGEPYYRVKTSVSTVGRYTGQGFKGSAMIQYHPADEFLYSESLAAANGTEPRCLVRPAFVHANTPKMNAGHLVDEGDLFAVDQKRLRLWGSEEEQEQLFGYDFEKFVWEILVKVGCELELVIEEWKSHDRLCKRIQEHWNEVF